MNAQHVKIHPPRRDQQAAIETLIAEVVNTAMLSEGVDPSNPDIRAEITRQVNGLEANLNGNPDFYYLVAESKLKVVATAAIVPVNEVIQKHLDLNADTPELGNVLVDHALHGHGIGAGLFRAIVQELQRRNVKDFVLDCGYGKSQGFWKHLLGSPDVTLKDYYAPGADHLIWQRLLADVVT